MSKYNSIDDLPQTLREQFPVMAQQLYLATYRRTLEKCQTGDQYDHNEVSDKAHDAALKAVEQQFGQDDQGNWYLMPVINQSSLNE